MLVADVMPSCLVSQTLSRNRQQLAPSTILSPSNASTDAAYLNIAEAPGDLIITWDEFPSGRRHATINGDSLTPTIYTTPASSIHIQRYPVATSGGSALMWLYGSGAGPKSLAGFTLDAAGEPWRSSAPSVDEETIELDWLFNVRDLSVSYGDSAIHTFQQSYGISYRDQGPDWFVVRHRTNAWRRPAGDAEQGEVPRPRQVRVPNPDGHPHQLSPVDKGCPGRAAEHHAGLAWPLTPLGKRWGDESSLRSSLRRRSAMIRDLLKQRTFLAP
jgi:hypothetical protein